MADTATWGILLGALTPLLTAVVEQPAWTPGMRKLAAAAVAAVVGVLTAAAAGRLGDPPAVVGTIAAVIGASWAAYEGLWRRRVAPAIEHATAVGRGNGRRRAESES